MESGDGRLISRHIDYIRSKSRLSDVRSPKDINQNYDKKDIGVQSPVDVGADVANEGLRNTRM